MIIINLLVISQAYTAFDITFQAVDDAIFASPASWIERWKMQVQRPMEGWRPAWRALIDRFVIGAGSGES